MQLEQFLLLTSLISAVDASLQHTRTSGLLSLLPLDGITSSGSESVSSSWFMNRGPLPYTFLVYAGGHGGTTPRRTWNKKQNKTQQGKLVLHDMT